MLHVIYIKMQGDELHNEINRDEVFADIEKWLEIRI